jgi:hypothetical protein
VRENVEVRCRECEGSLVTAVPTDESGREVVECSACRQRYILRHFSATASIGEMPTEGNDLGE